MADVTRVFMVGARDIAEEADRNEPTAAVSLAILQRLLPSAREAFVTAWQDLRTLSAELGRIGVVVAAVDQRGVVGRGAVAAHDDRLNTAIIGRHDSADLFLNVDPTLALRHLVLLVYPLRDRDRVHFRVLDLRTDLGFEDETQQRLHAVEANGPVFLTCAGYRLIALPTLGDGFASWPEDGGEVWDALPSRRFVDELGDAPPPAPAAPERPRVIREGSRILRLAGPVWSGAVQARPRRKRTYLRARLPSGSRVVAELAPEALNRGVLLGRYPRCAGAGMWPFGPTVSRVHALLIEVEGEPWLVDTASTNGIAVDGVRARQARLPADRAAALTIADVPLEWLPATTKIIPFGR